MGRRSLGLSLLSRDSAYQWLSGPAAFFSRVAANNRRLADALERAEKGIEWALGEGDSDFRPREPGEPPYYWRKRLREITRP